MIDNSPLEIRWNTIKNDKWNTGNSQVFREFLPVTADPNVPVWLLIPWRKIRETLDPQFPEIDFNRGAYQIFRGSFEELQWSANIAVLDQLRRRI